MKKSISAIGLALAVISIHSPVQAQQSEICPGCVDSTATPAAPAAVTGHDYLGALLFTVTYSVTVTQSDGICTLGEVIGTFPVVKSCQVAVPCTPHVEIKATIDDDLFLWDYGWSASGNGSVGYDPLSGTAATGSGDGVAVLYDKDVRLNCGRTVTSSAWYDLTLVPGGGTVGVSHLISTYDFEFICSSCSPIGQY